MAADPDAILLDRVFQPAVTAVAAWTTPFGMARGALVVAVEAQTMMLFWDVVGLQTAVNVVVVTIALGLTALGARQAWTMIKRAERQAKSGTMNVRRITLRRQRITWLCVCAGCSAMQMTTTDVRAAAGTIGCLGWIALIYFMSCDQAPPAWRRAGSRAPVAAGAG